MSFLHELWNYLLLSSPYLLIGFAASGLFHAFIPFEKVKKYLSGKRPQDIVWAALVGIPLPLCSCSVIPTAVTLKQAGAGNGPTSAFLISTPETGIDSLAMTYAFMDVPMMGLRIIAAFFSALLAGFLQFFFNEDQPQVEAPSSTDCCAKKTKRASLKDGMAYAFGDLVNDLALWLTVGILAGALIQTVVPENFFADLTSFQSRLLVMAVGIPFYICASASTPLAASLMLKGLSPGSALILLLVGPATNLSNIFVMQKYLGKKGILLNLLAIILVAWLMAIAADSLYTHVFPDALQGYRSHNQHEHISLLSQVCAVIMSLLLIKGILREKVFKK